MPLTGGTAGFESHSFPFSEGQVFIVHCLTRLARWIVFESLSCLVWRQKGEWSLRGAQQWVVSQGQKLADIGEHLRTLPACLPAILFFEFLCMPTLFCKLSDLAVPHYCLFSSASFILTSTLPPFLALGSNLAPSVFRFLTCRSLLLLKRRVIFGLRSRHFEFGSKNRRFNQKVILVSFLPSLPTVFRPTGTNSTDLGSVNTTRHQPNMAFDDRPFGEVRQSAQEENWWHSQPVTAAATPLQPAAAVATTADDRFLADAMAGFHVEQAQVARPDFDIIGRHGAPPPWQNTQLPPWIQAGQVRDRFPLPRPVHFVSIFPRTGAPLACIPWLTKLSMQAPFAPQGLAHLHQAQPQGAPYAPAQRQPAMAITGYPSDFPAHPVSLHRPQPANPLPACTELVRYGERAQQIQQPRTFRPMALVSPVWRALSENPTDLEIQRRLHAGVSANYRGNHDLASNRSADILDTENCSLWLEGLPPNITTRELLGAIRNVGRVWQSHIVRPTEDHTTAAAKITFFEASAAQTLIGGVGGQEPHRLAVGGHIATVVYNRQRVAQQTLPNNHTRVLLISGPPSIVNMDLLSAFFSSLFVYQLDEVIPVVPGRAISVLEWRFGSYRCQAQAAWEAFRRNPVFAAHGVTVRFDRDPCDYSPWGW